MQAKVSFGRSIRCAAGVLLACLLFVLPVITVFADDYIDLAEEDVIDAGAVYTGDEKKASIKAAGCTEASVRQSYDHIFGEVRDDGEQEIIEACAGGTGDQEALPAKYDPRDGNLLPALRDQGSLGICWAFGAAGSAEGSLIKKGLGNTETDLSERHLAYYMFRKGNLSDPVGYSKGDYNEALDSKGNDAYLKLGGNNLLTIWHLAGWCGLADESSYPYKELSNDMTADSAGLAGTENSLQSAYLSDKAHIQNAYVIDIGYSHEDESLRNTMKELVMKYGALSMGYRSLRDLTYDNPENDCYYYDAESTYPASDNWSTNHNALLVGWDDDFPKEKFNEGHRPEKDGAWLIRNSWGDEKDTYAQYGYFWMSYEEHSIRQVMDSEGKATNTHKYAFVFDAADENDYDHLYQYDGNANYLNYPSTVSGAGAIYRARGDEDERLEAVGVGTGSDKTSFKLTIYLDPEEGALESGTPAVSQEVELPYRGYHTVRLDKAVELKKGQRFAIVLTDLESPDPETGLMSGGARMSVANSQKVSASGGGVSGYWQFYSDASKDMTYVRPESSGRWYDLSDLRHGVYKKPTDDGEYVNTTGFFYESLLGSDRIVSVDRSGYTLRIKAYTSGGSITGDPDDDPSATPTQAPAPTQAPTQAPAPTQAQAPAPSATMPSVLSLTLGKDMASVSVEDKLQLTADAVFSDDNNRPQVIWSSSDPGVASVSGYGLVKGVSPGKAVITATASDVKAECIVSVVPKTPKGLKISGINKNKTGASVSLSWKECKADGYRIYRSMSEDGSWKLFAKVSDPESTVKKVKAVKGKKAYYYRVSSFTKAKDGTLLESAPGDPVSVVPSLKTVTPSKTLKGYVKLTLSYQKGSEGFVIYRRKKGFGSYRKAAVIRPGKRTVRVSYKDTKSRKQGSLDYRIYPCVFAGNKVIRGSKKEVSITDVKD